MASSSTIVCLLLLTVGTLGSLAYTEQENLAFIDSVLKLLNNNIECQLPTYDEVDEMQKCFVELEQVYGSELEWRLSDDQKLARKTILDQWSSFQQRMTNAVVIKSAKKRSFICKVEEYQKAKSGESVCARIKDVKGPITDRIFEKNPIVRYIKHIETGDVPERPVEEPTTTTTTTTTAKPEEVTTTGAPVPEPEPETEASQVAVEVTTEPVEVTEAPVEVTTEAVAPSNPIRIDDPEINSVEINLPVPEEQPDSNGVIHRVIGHFTIDMHRGPKQIVFRLDPGEDHDPLDDIPVPSSDDNEDDLAKNDDFEQTTTTEATPTEEATEPTTTTTTELPVQFDEFGAELIDEAYDDADLERLVRAPPKEWAFDPIFGYFKWPDEPQQLSFLKKHRQPQQQQPPSDPNDPNSSEFIRGQWERFTTDPNGFEAYLESLKPKFNQAALRLKKKQFMKSLHGEHRFHKQEQTFGWAGEKVAPERDPLVPEPLKSDRWTKLADNNFCKIDYNRDYIPNASKRGLRAVKSLFSSSSSKDKDDGITRKRRLIGNQ